MPQSGYRIQLYLYNCYSKTGSNRGHRQRHNTHLLQAHTHIRTYYRQQLYFLEKTYQVAQGSRCIESISNERETNCGFAIVFNDTRKKVEAICAAMLFLAQYRITATTTPSIESMQKLAFLWYIYAARSHILTHTYAQSHTPQGIMSLGNAYGWRSGSLSMVKLRVWLCISLATWFFAVPSLANTVRIT